MATLRQAISDLPPTPQQVAKLMKANGIKGRRMNPSGCAMARWLSRETGTQVYVSHMHCEDREGYVCHGQLVRDFIRLFDSGMFPELVEG